MDIGQVLGELGLTEGEIKVYMALLKLGSTTVSKVKEETGLHRTTIYDFVEKLLNKGLVNYVIRNNIRYYSAAGPEKLVEFLKEKQDHLNQVMPDLQKLSEFHKEEVKVEVYKGKEGLKTVLLECLRIGDETLGMGIDDADWKKALPVFIEQYQRMLKEKNIHERILTKMDSKYLFDPGQTHYKFLPESSFSPTHTLVYGNKIQLIIFEPALTAIVIESKELADAYRKHFNNLWDQESTVFRGDDDIKLLFRDMVETLKEGEEYLAFGVPQTCEYLVDFFDEIMDEFERNKVKSRVIFDERAVKQMKAMDKYSLTHYKKQSKEFMSPSEVNIYGNKVAIILWSKVPQAFVIDNKGIADSFRQYFEMLWKSAKV